MIKTTAGVFATSDVPTSSSPVESYTRREVKVGAGGLYDVLDERIGLDECEVFSYVPDIDADPHSDSDDDEDSSDSEEEPLFELDEEVEMEKPTQRHGALLWSSHWFFLNRRLNRILFISMWAKTRGLPHMAASAATSSAERFFAWEGGEGAGARAMGLL